VGIIGDSLDKAAASTVTRPIPKSAGAQIRFLVKHEKGCSTRIVAQRLGISQRTVERYLKGQICTPRPELAAKLTSEVRKNWQPRVRERVKKQAAMSTGIVIETRARFGFTAAPGSTDDGRIRRITQHLSTPTRRPPAVHRRARVRRPPTPADPRPRRRHQRVPIRGLTRSDDFPSPTEGAGRRAAR
jgi:hypothetical protein